MNGNQELKLELVAKDIAYVKEKLVDIDKKLENNYVQQIEFKPIKSIVYGLTGLVLTTVAIAIIGQIIVK